MRPPAAAKSEVIIVWRVFKMQGASKVGLSLAPGFSPVWNRRERTSRFNGFSRHPGSR
jgi:hypothetical protein